MLSIYCKYWFNILKTYLVIYTIRYQVYIKYNIFYRNSNLFLCNDQAIIACYMHGQLWITANMYGHQGLLLTGYANSRQLWLATCMSSHGLLHTLGAQGCYHIYMKVYLVLCYFDVYLSKFLLFIIITKLQLMPFKFGLSLILPP